MTPASSVVLTQSAAGMIRSHSTNWTAGAGGSSVSRPSPQAEADPPPAAHGATWTSYRDSHEPTYVLLKEPEHAHFRAAGLIGSRSKDTAQRPTLWVWALPLGSLLALPSDPGLGEKDYSIGGGWGCEIKMILPGKYLPSINLPTVISLSTYPTIPIS